MKLQISTVLTEIILRLDSSNKFCDAFLNSFNDIFDEHLIQETEKIFLNLVKNADYIRAYLLNSVNDNETSPKNFEEKKNDIYTVIHSLNLHLQAALYKLHNLENNMADSNEDETILNNTNSKTVNEMDYEDMKKHLQIIKAELDLSISCWEEASSRIDKKYNKLQEIEDLLQTDNKCVELSNENNVKQMDNKPTKIINLLEIGDPIIEDEVFEAFIDEEYSQRERENDIDDFWSCDQKKEREKIKNQKEQGKRVLRELQPILTKRREEWEERENLALKKKNTLVRQLYCFII